jgi:hypothetical protein
MRVLARLILLLSVTAAACGPTVDLTKGLKINVLETGWYDAGIVNGQNKLVPSITLTLTNLSDQTLVALQVNGSFRRVTEPEKEWGSRFVPAAGSKGLARERPPNRCRFVQSWATPAAINPARRCCRTPTSPTPKCR